MSGGRRQASAIARAPATPRPLDEPTAAISVRQVAEVLSLIRELRDRGLAIVLVNRRMPDVFSVAGRIVVLRRAWWQIGRSRFSVNRQDGQVREGFCMFRSSLLSVLLLVGISHTLAARQLTDEQRAAIRAACRSDFVANCSDVQPGTKAALKCLVGNEAKLSTPCRSAVSAITVKPDAPARAVPTARPSAPARVAPATTDEPAAAPKAPSAEDPPRAAAPAPKEDQLNAVRQACTLNDFIAHCSSIQPTSPKLLLCLEANAAELSPPCRAAVGSGVPGQTPPAVEAQPAEAAPPAPAWCGRICR